MTGPGDRINSIHSVNVLSAFIDGMKSDLCFGLIYSYYSDSSYGMEIHEFVTLPGISKTFDSQDDSELISEIHRSERFELRLSIFSNYMF